MASYTGDQSQNVAENEDILNLIEAVCINVTSAIIKGEVPRMSFSSRACWGALSFREQIGITLSEERKMVHIKLDNRQSVKSFAFMMKVLNIVYKLVQEDKYCTKRDIYYQNPRVFGSQNIIDNVVDNVACMLEVPRWKLHILGTCKGLVAGNLQFYDGQGRHIDCNHTKMGIQIPGHDKDMLYLHTEAHLLIVVEKDATFQKLLTEDFNATFGKVILITGKGYPDVGTRLLVHKIWDQFRLPVFALVDADPHDDKDATAECYAFSPPAEIASATCVLVGPKGWIGIEVMLVYKYGSKNQAYENQYLAVPALKWLGILPTDIKGLSLGKNVKMDLSKTDLQKLKDMYKRPYITPHSPFAQQLELMMQSGVKAEIQCLDFISSSYLSRVYLPSKVHGGDWI